MKESVLSFEEKSTQPWFTYFQIARIIILMYWLCNYSVSFKVLCVRLNSLFDCEMKVFYVTQVLKQGINIKT